MIMMKFQLSDYEQCLKQFTWDYRTFISDTEPIFIFPLFLFARSQERINIGLSWSYGNKTFEHEFVLILEKNSQSEECIKQILCSDWTVLEYEYVNRMAVRSGIIHPFLFDIL